MRTCDKCPCDEFAEERKFFCEILDRKVYRHHAMLCRTDDRYRRYYLNGEAAPRRPPPSGPGTELLKILRAPFKLLEWLPFTKFGGCAGRCVAYAAKMDAWGVAGCRKRLEEIVDHLEAEAKKEGLPFSRRGARLLVRLAIRRAKSTCPACHSK